MVFSFKTSKFYQRRGTTLPELIVAVGITAGMMLAASMVFNAATGASGKAMASLKMTQQLNTITQQLKRDVSHLRPDLPFGILFQEEIIYIDQNDTVGEPHRVDRLFFFTTGNFEVTSAGGTDQSKLAMVNYGQSYEAFENFDLDYVTPQRRLFCRREKLVAQSTVKANLYMDSQLPDNLSNVGPWQYDTIPFLYLNGQLATLNDIKTNAMHVDFKQRYFSNNIGVTESFIRRPEILHVDDYDGSGAAMQRLLLLADVTDFQIDLWFDNINAWWPDEPSWFNNDFSANRNPFGFYWNVNNSPVKWVDGSGAPTPSYAPTMVNRILWWDEGGFAGALVPPPNVPFTPIPSPVTWPSALRFTFTLYDENRRHFPEGKSFSYIVKLPKRQ